MGRKVAYAIGAFFAVGSIFGLFQAAKASELSDITQSTVKLYAFGLGNCSATFLQNTPEGAQFLTAAHCVEGKKGELTIRRQRLNDKFELISEEVFYLKAVRTLGRKDVAILQTTDNMAHFNMPGVDVATPEEAATLNVGDRIIAVGYPGADQLAVTSGEFTAIVPVPMGLKSLLDAPMYQTTVPVAGGNSGGGLYAQFDGEWKLIGTTTAKRQDNDIMTYFQTADTVNEVLKGFVTNGTFQQPIDKQAIRQSPLTIDQR